MAKSLNPFGIKKVGFKVGFLLKTTLFYLVLKMKKKIIVTITNRIL